MMNDGICGKHILFICPKFIGYDLALKKEMANLGANVYMLNDRPYNGFYDFFKKININLIKAYQHVIWLLRLMFLNLEQYDLVLVIRGEHIPPFFLKRIKVKIATRILYQWDSVTNYNYLSDIDYYSQVYTFDRSDAEKFNFSYLPLFYRREYEMARNKKSETSRTALFVGTFQENRYETMKHLSKSLDKLNINVIVKFKIPIYYYLKLLLKRRKLDLNILTFTNISFKQLIALYSIADIIIDVANENQTGLTMRTLEALGSKKELITNNQSIALEPFYNSGNVTEFEGSFKWLWVESSLEEFRIDNWILKLCSYYKYEFY